MRYQILFLVGSFGVAMAAGSQTTKCQTVRDCAQQAVEVAASVQTALGEVTQRLDALRGSVVAFELPECPGGWVLYEDAIGRVLVGATADKGAKKWRAGDTGGAEQVTLTLEQLPAHHHVIANRGSTRVTASENGVTVSAIEGNSFNTENAGDGKPHENMPPYRALIFCTMQ